MIRKLAFVLASTLALAATASAQSPKMISITLHNRDNDDLRVHLFDRNQGGKDLYNAAILKQGRDATVQVMTDASGKGRVQWMAQTVTGPGLKCQKADVAGVNGGATINVAGGVSGYGSSC
jgi:hypothetical protein